MARGDANLIGLGVSNPATLVPFFSGPVPTSGNNFGHINNPQYTAGRQGREAAGTAGCADWNAAESSLFSGCRHHADLGSSRLLYWGKNVRFQVIGHILIPTSLRAING